MAGRVGCKSNRADARLSVVPADGERAHNDPLTLIALAVERDRASAEDMAAWDATSGDGLDDMAGGEW